MSDDCIFCRIVAGELPCTRVYEDADVLAFLDIGPIIKGHTLVIPKAHHESIVDTPPELLRKAITVVRAIAGAEMAGLKADGVNVTQANGRSAGQVVPHLHFHVIPRFETDGHKWNWRTVQYAGSDEMTAVAADIRKALGPHA